MKGYEVECLDGNDARVILQPRIVELREGHRVGLAHVRVECSAQCRYGCRCGFSYE